jgi:large subunit ribosomal protein L24
MKFNIRKNDTVIVTNGKSTVRGQVGRVREVRRKDGRVVVEGVNMVTKHIKATEERSGQRIQKEAALHISNVAFWNADESRRVKVGFRRVQTEGGLRTERFDKKTGDAI